jgi:hypothetical protein
MTITALEIAAIFKIVDEATPVFERIAERAQALAKELGEVALKIDKNFGASFKEMQTGIGDQIAEVGRLTAAWERAGVAAGAAGRASAAGAVGVGGGGRRLGGGGGGGGGGFRPSSVDVPGGHMHGGTGVLVGAGLSAYALAEAYKVDDITTNAIASAFPKGMPDDVGAKRKQLIDIIKHESEVTGIPLQKMSEMVADEIRVNASLPWEQRLQNIPIVIEGAAAEAAKKGIDPVEGVKAFVGGLHQNQAFTPEDIAKKGGMLAYFASVDPNSVTNFTKSSAYHTSILGNLMGVPMEQDLAAQVVLDRAGVGGKSGTWLREMVLNASIPSFKDKGYKKKMGMLREWGLADEYGHSTVMTDGHYDEQKMLHTISEHLKTIPVERRAGDLKQLFGTRGSEAAAILTNPDMLKQFDQVLGDAQSVQDPKEWWAQQAKLNPALRMRQDWVKAQEAALAGGQILQPMFSGIANTSAAVLGWGANYLPQPGSAGEKRGEAMGAGAAIGAGIGGVVGGVAGGIGGAGVGAIPGALGGAALGGAIGGAGGYLVESFIQLKASAESAAKALGTMFPGPGPGIDSNQHTGPSNSNGPVDDNQQISPKRMNYIPPPQGTKPIVTTTNISIDGNVMARALAQYLAEMLEFPNQAPYGDDSSSYHGPAGSTTDT